MRFGDLTYREIADYAAADTLVLVPTGCTEQQGPHLPVDFDTWFAETLMLAASERLQAQGVAALVLPVLPFGPTPEHRGYGSGFIDIPVALHTALLRAVLESLLAQGFRRTLIWRGCGGHDLTALVASFNQQHAGQAHVALPPLPYHDLWCRLGDAHVAGGHADSFTTSLALYLRPAAVRASAIPAPELAPVDWDDPALDFRRYSASGVIGDATKASAALGRQLWAGCVDAAVAAILASQAVA